MYMHIYANLPLWHMSQVNLNIQFDISQKIFQHIRTNFENLSTIEPFLRISAHSDHFFISQHIRTCVIYIYAPKHIMPSIFRALSLYTHTRSAHIHARNLFTFMQRYLYCAPFGARIGVWCWKTPCGQHVAVTKHMHRFYHARSIYSCVRIPSRARCVRRKANLRCITARITWLFHV